MHDKVKKIINKIYIEKDYDYFILKSVEPIELPDEFIDFINNTKFFVEQGNDKVHQEKTFYIEYKKYFKEGLIINYNSIIKISKLDLLYYIQHEFEIDNKDPERMCPTLDGFSDAPYNKSQAEFDQHVSKILNNHGYLRLEYRDMEEVVEGLKMPEDVTLFGPQVTVETALFRDVFELVPDE